MSSPRPLLPQSAWTHWYRRVLPAYWIFVFCSTHFPKLSLEGLGFFFPTSDKVIHAIAFALLAFLFWRFVETFRRPLSGRFVWIALFWLSLYAAVDEYLQGFVGRRVDIWDWLYGEFGMVIVLALLEWRRRVGLKRRPAVVPP